MAQSGNNQQTIGRYQIKQLLGRGGMASVYLAHDPHFGRDVAIKILPREFLHDPQFLNRFQREARTIASLDHPAIVPVYDYGENDGQPYLVMRYMAGGSLAEHLRMRTIPISETIHIIRRLASALDEAHANGIVHRDLKPGNVLFDHRGDAFLSDFGIVKMTQGSPTFTTGTGVIGTPAYMSPEQVHGDKKLDGRSDVYTLGVMLFQMISGEMPYKADTPVKQMMAHVLDPIPNINQLRPDLPPGFDHVITKALAKKREERFTTASRIVDALETLTNAGQPTPQSISLLTPPNANADTPANIRTDTIFYNTETITNTPPQTEGNTRPWLWYTGGGLLAAIVIIGIILFSNNSSIPDPTPTSAILIAAATEEPQPTQTAELQATEEPAVLATATTPPTTDSPPPTSTSPPQPTSQPTETTISESDSESASPPPGEPFELALSANKSLSPPIVLAMAPKASSSSEASTPVSPPPQSPSPKKRFSVLKTTLIKFRPASLSTSSPNLNPDSTYDPGQLPGRLNTNGADLNRNWDCRWQADDTFRNELVEGMGGTAPFSEPEVAALSNWLLNLEPVGVIFWQARATNGLVSPGSCRSVIPEVSAALAETYSQATGYSLQDFEQLAQEPVNGDAVNWIDSQGIPAISVLLPDYLDADIENNLAAVATIIERFGN